MDQHDKYPSAVYNKITGKNKTLNHKFYLKLNLEKDVNRKLIKALKFIRLPELRGIKIRWPEIDDQDVKEFMSLNISESSPHPKSLQNFWFDCWHGHFQEITNYMGLLK